MRQSLILTVAAAAAVLGVNAVPSRPSFFMLKRQNLTADSSTDLPTSTDDSSATATEATTTTSTDSSATGTDIPTATDSGILPTSTGTPSTTNFTDQDLLNFALSMEHLQNAFYNQGLAQYDASAFTSATLPKWSRGRFVQISEHTQSYVTLLEGVLGENATQPCQYSFPYTDPVSFSALSQVLEGVATAAYVGAAQLVTDKEILTTAMSIATSKGRHAAWVAGAVDKQEPWSGAFDVPLGLNLVYSIASAYITTCPDTNPVLPVQSYPALTATADNSTLSLSYNTTADASTPTYAIFYTGLSTTAVEITNGSSVTLPADLHGQVYVVVSTASVSGLGQAVPDDSVIAGPVIFQFPFSSEYTDATATAAATTELPTETGSVTTDSDASSTATTELPTETGSVVATDSDDSSATATSTDVVSDTTSSEDNDSPEKTSTSDDSAPTATS